MAQLSTRPIKATEIEDIVNRLFEGLLDKFGEEDPTLTLRISFSVPGLDQTVMHKSTRGRTDWKEELSAKMRPFKELDYVNVQSWQLSMNAKSSANLGIAYSLDKSGLFGLIGINDGNTHPIPPETMVKTFAALGAALPLATRRDLIQASTLETYQSQLQYQEQILVELQSASSRLARETTDFLLQSEKNLQRRFEDVEAAYHTKLADLQNSFDQRNNALTDSYEERRAELEATFTAREGELINRISSREEALASREEELRKQLQELDLRNATAARRANQKQIQAVVEEQKRVEISKDTQAKRRTVHWLCGFGLACFGGMASFFLYQIVASSTNDFRWHLALPLSTGLVGFASTLVYWIRWSDDWFREHARAEFANRKLFADTNRAAWLVEVLLEWSRDGKEAIPSAVVESLTKNLFTDINFQTPAHASDVLEKFVAKLANIRVSNDEVELGSKGQAIRNRN